MHEYARDSRLDRRSKETFPFAKQEVYIYLADVSQCFEKELVQTVRGKHSDRREFGFRASKGCWILKEPFDERESFTTCLLII